MQQLQLIVTQRNIIISENKDGVFKYDIGGLELEKHRKKNL